MVDHSPRPHDQKPPVEPTAPQSTDPGPSAADRALAARVTVPPPSPGIRFEELAPTPPRVDFRVEEITVPGVQKGEVLNPRPTSLAEKTSEPSTVEGDATGPHGERLQKVEPSHPRPTGNVEPTDPARATLEPRVETPEQARARSLHEVIKTKATEFGQPINLTTPAPDGTDIAIGTSALATLSNPSGNFHAQIITEQLHDFAIHDEQADTLTIIPGRETVHVLWMDTKTNQAGIQAWIGTGAETKVLSSVYKLTEPTPEEAELSVAERLKTAERVAMTPEDEVALASRLAEATHTYLDAESVAGTMARLPRSLPAFLDPSTQDLPTQPAPVVDTSVSVPTSEPPLTTEWVVNGVAQPVTVTEYLGTDPATGREYVGIKGFEAGIPVDQIHPSDQKAFKDMLQNWIDTATTRPEPTQQQPVETAIYSSGQTQRPTERTRPLSQTSSVEPVTQRARTLRSTEVVSSGAAGAGRPPAIDVSVKPFVGKDVNYGVVSKAAAVLIELFRQILKPNHQVIAYHINEKTKRCLVKVRTDRGKIIEVIVNPQPGETIQEAFNRQRLRNMFVR